MDILVLGPVGLRIDGGLVDLGSDKSRTLLAALALDAGRAVSLDTLVGRLWDGEAPDRARENVHVYVSRIRKRLRLAGDSAPRITGRAHTYCLEGDDDLVDWQVFRRLVAARPADDDRGTVDLLTRADGLWQGEPLAGLPGAWAEDVRRTLEESRLRATVLRTGAQLRLGHFADVVGELSALAGRYPADETVLGQLMVAYYGSGRYGEALRVHQDARQTLTTEFGTRPGPELNRLHVGILDHVPVRDLVPGARPTAPEGSPRTGPGTGPGPGRVGGSGKRAAPVPPAPRNLPHQPPLVGRSAELRSLTEAVTATAYGAVISLETVSGMAGVGKTTVAVHTAMRLAARYPAAQLYVDLRAHSPAQRPLAPAEALATLLRLLGAPAQTIPVDLDERITLWRHMLAERRAVVVLDDAVNAAQVAPLLPEGSSSLVIITSRRHLTGLPHARTIALDVLPTPDAIALFRRFAGEDRTADVREVRRIVQLCGHLPLAIELVATRFQARPSWTPATLGDRLARSPGRLAEIRDADTEMARAFDLSYRTLTDDQRTAFRRLSLHPGGDFGAEVAAAMLDVPVGTAERLLEELMVCHLLREPQPDRYRYHDLLREYARSLALSEDDSGSRAHVLRRMTDFYGEAVDRADRVAYPRRLRRRLPRGEARFAVPVWPDADAAKSWLETERGNLLAAEDHARAEGDHEGHARIAYSLAGFLEAECHWQDAESVLRHAVAHWAGSGTQDALCRALISLSATHGNTGRYLEAADTGTQALGLARATGDTEAEAEALRIAGMLNWHLGENRAALDCFQKSLAIKAATGDAWQQARVQNNVAITLLFLGEHDRALEYFQQAIAGFTEGGDKLSSAKALNNVGDLRLREGNYPEARRHFEEALSFMETAGNRYDRATARASLADTLTEIGEAAEALPLFRESLQEFQSLGDSKSQAETLIGIGEAHRRVGSLEEAVNFQTDALRLATDIGAAHQVAQAHRCLGRAHLERGRVDLAVGHFETAGAAAARIHDLDEVAAAHMGLAEARMALGGPADIRALVSEGLASLDALDPEELDILRIRLADFTGAMDGTERK
ncbi:AfsR/SARP family transcriptional regulator [Streptomyces sp. NPDC091292]|uniref:AfsR/SARP family transcriptional regulator n=1 Tax=Streptomyces sp. NPDC091292 TaxID=3365991 RepID=UPI00381DDF1E